MDILADIKTGLAKTTANLWRFLTAGEAIRYCIEHAEEGDIIVLAGKGHEDYQEIHGVKRHFDERGDRCPRYSGRFEKGLIGFDRPSVRKSSAVGGRLLCGRPAAAVTSVGINSRNWCPERSLFPIRGARVDAHDFIPAAIKSGAAAVFTQEHVEAPADAAGAWIAVRIPPRPLRTLRPGIGAGFPIPVIGVGEVGKTTTKEMVGAAPSGAKTGAQNRGNFNSQIGLPPTVFRLESRHEIAILEMGIERIGEMGDLARIALQPRCCDQHRSIPHRTAQNTREHPRGKASHHRLLPPEGALFLNGMIRSSGPCGKPALPRDDLWNKCRLRFPRGGRRKRRRDHRFCLCCPLKGKSA